MRFILGTLIFLFMTGASAQINPGFPPYNPDSDMDGWITVEDLASFLTLFSSEFSAYSMSLSSDSSQAVLYVGQLDYYDCRVTCDTIQGNWKLLELDSYGYFRSELDSLQSNGQYAWLNHGWVGNNKVLAVSLIYDSPSEISAASTCNCICQAETYPLVEYDVCYDYSGGNGSQSLEDCVNAKLNEGWHLLGGVSFGSSYQLFSQAVWRWAE